METERQMSNPTFEITVRQMPHTVTFQLETHQFVTEVGGVTVRSDSVDGLTRLIENEMARQKVKLNFRFMTQSGILGTATGIHGRTGHVTVQWDEGVNEQLATIVYPLRPETDREELDRLNKAYNEADLARKAFIKENCFDPKRFTSLKDLVKNEIQRITMG
jgi:hypothetical protein